MTISQHPTNTKQLWLDHIKQWQDSGLSQTDYCKQYDLKPHSLSYHKCKQTHHRVETQLTPSTSTGFLQVSLKPMTPLPEPLILHFSSGLQLTGLTTCNVALVKQLTEVLL